MYLLCVFVTFFASMWRVKNCSSPDGNYCFDKPCRLSQSEFIIPYSKFMKSFSQPFSAGLRFKMRYESDDATERRYAQLLWSSFLMGLEKLLWSYTNLWCWHARLFCRYTGIIAGIGDADPMWRGSKWKCLMVCCLFLQDIYAFITSFFIFLQDAFITSLPFCVTFLVLNLSYMCI